MSVDGALPGRQVSLLGICGLHFANALLPPVDQPPPVWPLAVYFGAAVFITAAIIVISYFLGPRHREPATGEPYEGGIVPVGSARMRISAKFYLIAMFFVIFDLEAVFIYSWAVAGPDAGWWGYWELLVFAGVLIASLGYLWRIGAFDWAHARRRRR